jgi:hypothetical protein
MATKNRRHELKSSRNGRVSSRKISSSQVKSPADSLVCPICLELPYYPVTAEDGRVYERSAILKHIDRAKSRGIILRSPVTKEKMGPRLMPAVHIKNIIETLIKNGAIEGELATWWKEKEQRQKDREAPIRNDEGGDRTPIHKVGKLYASGQKVSHRNLAMWFKKDSDVFK